MIQKTLHEKWYYWLERFFLLIFFCGALVHVIRHFLKIGPYSGYHIGDWLINYQGGFVRRGLIGELLWQIYTIYPFSVKWAILLIGFISFVAFSWLIYRVFRQYHWSFLPILFPFVVGFFPISAYRRDFLMLILTYLSFDLFFRYIKVGGTYLLITVLILLSFILLVYEPIFFVLVPLLIVVFWQNTIGNLRKKLFRTILHFALPLVLMFVVCKMHGDTKTAETIWASWRDCFDAYPDGSTSVISEAVAFLGKDVKEVMLIHLDANFKYTQHPSLHVLLWQNLALLASFIGMFFLTTRVPCVDSARQCLIPNTMRVDLTRLYIFQTIMMIPMFTVLSCDFGRTIPYVVFTTYFAYHLLAKYQLRFMQLLVPNIPLARHSWLQSPMVYFLVILCTPFVHTHTPSWMNSTILTGIWAFRILLNKLL